jgi:hypothetical protein
LDVNGGAISLTKLFVSPVISMLVALAVSPLRSRIASAIFILSLLASIVLAYLDLVEDYWRNTFAIGALSILVDVVAAITSRFCGLVTKLLGGSARLSDRTVPAMAIPAIRVASIVKGRPPT